MLEKKGSGSDVSPGGSKRGVERRALKGRGWCALTGTGQNPHLPNRIEATTAGTELQDVGVKEKP